MTKDIQLFDYQEDMVKRVLETFRYHDSVMVQMPTGTGKTMVLANIVFSFLEKSNNPIWIVAHRRELVSQIKETIFSKITPSLFTLKEGSTAFPKPLSPQGTGDVTALRCSEPLRSKVGGPSKVSPDCLSAGALRVSHIKCLLQDSVYCSLGEGLPMSIPYYSHLYFCSPPQYRSAHLSPLEWGYVFVSPLSYLKVPIILLVHKLAEMIRRNPFCYGSQCSPLPLLRL